jgi:glycosyltransferase involved in cell wall biosynthesis
VRVGRPRLGMVGPFPPHRSGLAGYGGELARSLRRELDVVVCAVDRYGLTYSDDVVAVVGQDRLADYRRGARILAEHRVDAVLIHYDDAAYGGPAGAHVLDLAHELRLRDIPYLVQLHSLRRPADPTWLRTVSALGHGAARVLVTTEDARSFLTSRHLVDPSRMRVVRVGASGSAASPVRPVVVDAVAGAGHVVTTLGSIRPGKGLDTALDALAKVAATRPDVRYVVAGTGEGYADELRGQAERLGLAGVVRILDTYLSGAEIADLLAHTDVYLMPGLPSERTWSGTLTGAVAAGCAIVAGEHPFTRELLGGARPAGLVVPATADDLGLAVLSVLDDPSIASSLHTGAARVGRTIDGPRVAKRVAGVVREVVRPATIETGVPLTALASFLTADIAEDPALEARRAVVAAAVLGAAPAVVPGEAFSAAAGVAQRSLRRLSSAHASDGESLVGLSIWAAGVLASGSGVPQPVREEARAAGSAWYDRLPLTALPAAYACLGLARLRSAQADPVLARAAARIDAAVLRAGRGASWPWFTARLDGEGVRVPHALIAAGLRLRDPSMVRRGLGALDWYTGRVGLGPADGVLRLPWSSAGLEPATHAGALVEALVAAHGATGSSHYARLAMRAWQWFLGANRHAEPIYDEEGGWCRVGLRPQAPDRTADGLLTVVDGPSISASLAFAAATLSLHGAGLVSLPAVGVLAAA